MNEFMKMMSGMGDFPSEDEFSVDFDAGMETAQSAFHECRDIILAKAKPFAKSDKETRAFQATMIIFATVWMLVGWAFHAVKQTSHGKNDSPMYKLWGLLKTTFEGGPDVSSEEIGAKLVSMSKEWKL